MLTRVTFTQQYIDDCRTHLRRKAAAFEAVRTGAAEVSAADLSDDLAQLEPRFFNALVTALETMFMHRPRVLEGTEHNALHEVRVLATAIREHHAVVRSNIDAHYDAEQSLLGLRPGDKIALAPHDFECLADSFFMELSNRYVGEAQHKVAA
jgi:hypothetical protein